MTVKMTVNLAQDEYSWTETFYLTAFSQLQSAVAKAAQYAALRAATLGAGARIQAIRLSTVPASRNVIDLTPPAIASTGPLRADVDPSADTYSSDRAYAALLVRMTSTALTPPKNWFMSGIPDGMIQTTPQATRGYNPAGAFQASGALSAMFAELAGGGYAWRSRDSGVLTQASGAPVTNAGYPNLIGITTPASIGVTTGQEVLVQGWRRINPRSPTLNAVWRIAAVIPPTAPATTPWTYMLLNSAAVSPTNFKTVGLIGPLVYSFSPVSTVQVIKAVSHKRGASYGAPRGRLPISA